jgi:GH24 family phage-related lysozyme (muramidase)
MNGMAQAIKHGLTTATGMNVQGVILIALALVSEMEQGTYRQVSFVLVLLVWAFVSFITRGHEALPQRIDEPMDDLDHDAPMDDVLAQGRSLLDDPNFTKAISGQYNTPLGLMATPALPTMAVSQRGIDLIKQFEGCKLTAYWDKWGKVWTIGYGWTIGVKKGDRWTQAKAEKMLTEGVKPYAKAVADAIGTAPTTQGAFDAMTSFCYNAGPANFRKSSMLRFHRQGNRTAAGNAFLAWNKAGGVVLKGLVRRREAERALYLS